MKKLFAALLIITLVLSAGCNSQKNPPAAPAGNDGAAELPLPQNEQPDGFAPVESGRLEAPCVLGLCLYDDKSDAANMTMFGFLRTAETLGYAAKVYRASGADNLAEVVEQASAQGIKQLMLFDPNAADPKALDLAVAKGMQVVVPFNEINADGICANVVADNFDYYDELARGIAQRMDERSLKSGRILVYGRETQYALECFESSLKANFPQFVMCEFTRTAQDDEGAIEELAQFILNNRDIKGMYVIDSDSSSIAVKARSRAQKLFANMGNKTPEQTPQPTPAQNVVPGVAPAYTPNPNLLKQIMITLFANGLSDENYELFGDNDIYALCIEPYYEAAAQATMLMDRLARGETVPERTKVNRPIVYADTAEKYIAIYDQMKAAFAAAQ